MLILTLVSITLNFISIMHSIHPIGLDPTGPDDIINLRQERLLLSQRFIIYERNKIFQVFYILVLEGNYDVLKHYCLISQGSF